MPDPIVRIASITIKHYPNKQKKKDTHPDLRGAVQIVYTDGLIQDLELSSWKPGAGKSQTTTKWAPKWKPAPEDGDTGEEGERRQEQPAAQQQTQAPTPPPSPAAPAIVDDADDWA